MAEDARIAELRRGVTTGSAEETHAFAAALAGQLPANTTLALSGDLGSGKTTFVQGLGRAWGITQPISSPTFNLYHIYRGQRQLVHLDAYRLNSAAEADDLLIEDFLEEPWCLAIEWPERLDADWLKNAWHLACRFIDEQTRWFQLEQT